jgi:FkbM family methyltransferase
MNSERDLKLILRHLPGSLAGFLRFFLQQPGFAVRLFLIRLRYLGSRSFKGDFITPDGFHIETADELISYWSFFVEREGWTSNWGSALAKEKAPLVLDVGANAGLFSHWIWSQNRQTRLIVFEPLPVMADKIRSWIKRTGAGVTLHQQAVSDHCGEATFFTNADNDTGASLRDYGKSNKLTVSLTTLDTLAPKQPILLLKIDVEGCEPQVLRGATETLRQTRFLIAEAHTKEALDNIRAILDEKTWSCQRVGSSDYVFERQSGR